MIAKMEVMPFQRLPVSIKAFHHPLLDRKRAVIIMAAVKNHRRALDLTRGIARVTRPNACRGLVCNRGIVGNKRTRGWCRGDKMDAQPPTHAVANDANP